MEKEHMANSDHNIVSCRLRCRTQMEASNTSVYAFKKADYIGMNKWLNLNDIQWDTEFANLEVDSMLGKFSEIIDKAIIIFVPKSKVRKIK
jgi:hypothetical protein